MVKRHRQEQQFDPTSACRDAKFRFIEWVLLDGTPSSEEVTESAQLLKSSYEHVFLTEEYMQCFGIRWRDC